MLNHGLSNYELMIAILCAKQLYIY